MDAEKKEEVDHQAELESLIEQMVANAFELAKIELKLQRLKGGDQD